MSYYDFDDVNYFTGRPLPGVEDRSHITSELENKSSNMETAATISELIGTLPDGTFSPMMIEMTEAAVSQYLSREFVDYWMARKEIFGKGFKLIMEDLRCKNGKFQVLFYVYRPKKKFPLFLAEKDTTGKLIIRSLTKDYHFWGHNSPMYGFANDPFIIEIRRRPKTLTYDIYKKTGYHPDGEYILQSHSFEFMKRHGRSKYTTNVFSMMDDDSGYLKMPMIKLPNCSKPGVVDNNCQPHGYESRIRVLDNNNSDDTFDQYVIDDPGGTSDKVLSFVFAIAVARLDTSSDEFQRKLDEEIAIAVARLDTSSDEFQRKIEEEKKNATNACNIDDKVNLLPKNWTEYLDSSTGISYYYNSLLDEMTWERPAVGNDEATNSEKNPK